MKVLVIGHPEAVLGFSLAGVQGVAVSTAEETNKALDEALATADVGIVLVTQNVSNLVQGRMDDSRAGRCERGTTFFERRIAPRNRCKNLAPVDWEFTLEWNRYLYDTRR
jgi:hypothetical protein